MCQHPQLSVHSNLSNHLHSTLVTVASPDLSCDVWRVTCDVWRVTCDVWSNWRDICIVMRGTACRQVRLCSVCIVLKPPSLWTRTSHSSPVLGLSKYELEAGLVWTLLCSYHIHNLLECQPEPQLHSLRLIGHGSLQLLVEGHQVVEELPLACTAVNHSICNNNNINIIINNINIHLLVGPHRGSGFMLATLYLYMSRGNIFETLAFCRQLKSDGIQSL